MKRIFQSLSIFVREEKAFAHCDIPCGVYDPFVIQRAAYTIIRMTGLLNDLKADINAPLEQRKKIIHDISRITKVKEDHSDLLEEELDTLRNDYFKKEHYDQYPNLNDLFINLLKEVSKVRQNIDLASAKSLLSGVQEIAEIFYKTKGAVPVKVKSIYPTEGEIVVYK
jgi:nickel superoxide dismutase